VSPEQGQVIPDALRKQMQAEILKAFDLKPWHAGLAPVPWRVRVWRKISFARWRVSRAVAAEEIHRMPGEPED